MRAVAVRAFRQEPELLELPRPEPGDGELRVRIEAAGMNPFDRKIADGIFEGHRRHLFPLVLGVDGCGTVDTLGPGAARFRRGERVVGSFLHDPVGTGTYAEYAVVPETNCIVSVPPGLDATVAASLPTAGMTALQSLNVLAVPAGGRLLIVGAAGGVGSLAVGLAHARAISVVAVARAGSHERLHALGADVTAERDDAARDPELPGTLDGLLDVGSSPEEFDRWARLLRSGSTAVSTIGSARPVPGVRTVSISMEPAAADLASLVRSVADGSVRSPVDRTLPLAEAPRALRDLKEGRLTGKTVLLPS